MDKLKTLAALLLCLLFKRQLETWHTEETERQVREYENYLYN